MTIRGKTWFGATMALHLPDLIQENILLSGYWEPAISSYIANALKPGDVFIDIGANVGYYSLLASHLVQNNGLVYSFEASPSIFTQLTENLAINAAHNVRAQQIAIGNRAEEVWIWSAPQGNIGHSTIMANVAENDGHSREARIECAPLNQLIDPRHLLSARLVKIDTEGAERLVIEGISAQLGDFSNETEWLVELSPAYLENGKSDSDWIFEAFANAGYAAFKVRNDYARMLQDSWDPHPCALIPLTEPPDGDVNDVLFTKRHPPAEIRA